MVLKLFSVFSSCIKLIKIYGISNFGSGNGKSLTSFHVLHESLYFKISGFIIKKIASFSVIAGLKENTALKHFNRQIQFIRKCVCCFLPNTCISLFSFKGFVCLVGTFPVYECIRFFSLLQILQHKVFKNIVTNTYSIKIFKCLIIVLVEFLNNEEVCYD